MYVAKDKGRNNFQFCTQEMTEKAENKGILQNNLREALENNEFILYYQPKIDVMTQKIVGVEGLMRWQRPEGLLTPAKFIGAIESCDLIVPVGEWVLRTACLQNKAWQNAGLPPLSMSINLSVRNLNQQLLRVIERILEESELNPATLEIELTEGVLMDNVENNIYILNSLKDMGLKLAIDDFGTGYSSLSYLKRFPIDVIKIDQSFVSDLGKGESDSAIVIAIIAMSHSLGFKVIAEGVETLSQLKFLCENGCDEIQGYYFSCPLEAQEATHYIQNANIPKLFKF
jgi:EAL domain-containing protein (putative c-di-GMP-specific phosphodiesterase class I)